MEFQGFIVEESLKDTRVLNHLSVLGVQITDDDAPEDRWHIFRVQVNAEQIADLSEQVKQGWYMHFWHDRRVIAVFAGRMFKFDYDDKATWRPVMAYGRALGIPEEQLNFPIE